ncbi:MAG: gliding motility-associated C-terminal domain-containing protein [Bacteroidetes bacterium]|nr:gliding motility-associated C-terminal domain-containing protein [Bacteroidota bacterium]
MGGDHRGKWPSNQSRAAIYQSLPCGLPLPSRHFVYGESPWGTGNPGDGPNLGVNDGQSVSSRQPGGCGRGADTLTRWWGCYPVIGGVGSNGWAALAPNAGPDDSICQTATAHLLLANTPPGTATGTWSVVSQPLGSPPVTFTDPNNPNAFVQNLQGFGPYTFVWDINYGGCPSLPDTVVITRVPNSSTANTMADTTLTCNGDTLTLRGNDPGNGWSIWTTSDPGITLLNPSDSITQAFGLAPGLNVFTYAITNGVCPVTTAQVNVYVPINVTANAGPDQQLCLASIATLAGNDPDSIQTSANGFWSQVSGPNNGIFTNLSQNSSNFSALIPGQYTLVWSVTNFDCPMATDTMVITNYQSVIADAGGDQVYCFPSDGELLGNNIYSLSSTAVGLWTQLSGPTQAGIQNPDTFFSFVNNLVAGSYAFSWLVSNGVCPPDSDVVRFDVYDIQPNGVIDSLRPDSGQSNGNIIVALPSGGISPYTYSIDGLNFQSNSTFDSLGAGIYEIIVMDNNGCVDSFLIELDSILPTIPPPPRDTLKVPTGFSPNGDGTNDTWEIPGIEAFPNARIDVYNIWGGLVYSSAGVYIPWNGQRGGQDLPAANYYFILDLKAEGQPVLKGSITILR